MINKILCSKKLRILHGPAGSAGQPIINSKAQRGSGYKPDCVMLVKNSVSHDSRVIREAESLSEAGYRVSVVGILDNRDSRQYNKLSGGTEIFRVPFRAQRESRRLFVFKLGFYSGLALIAAFIILMIFSLPLFESLVAFISNQINPVSFSKVLFIIIYLLILVAACVFIYKGVRFLIKQKKILHNYSKMDGLTDTYRKESFRLHDLSRYLYLWENMQAMNRAMYQKLSELKPRIIHCHDLNTINIGYKYKKKHSGILIYDSHEIFEEQPLHNPVSKRVYIKAQKRYSRYVDHFIVVNNGIGNYLKEKYPRLPDPVVIMNAVNESPFEQNNDLRELLSIIYQREKGLKNGQNFNPIDLDFSRINILLYHGGFAKHRGLDKLVESSAYFNNNWILVMIGWGTFEKHLINIAGKFNIINNKVFFIPPISRDELIPFSSGATAGIIPYENTSLNHYHCTPNKLWEFPAAGLPVLISPFPELTQLVNKYEIGWLLDDPVNPVSIKETVNSLDVEEIKIKKYNCKNFTQSEHWNKYKDRLLNLYNSIKNV